MRVVQMVIEGDSRGVNRRAHLKRELGAGFIEIETAKETRQIPASGSDERWAAAEWLQAALDGFRGCGGDVRDYFNAIQSMAG